MAKNQIQFQKGLSLLEFLSQYGTEEQCRDALFEWHWPKGFVCPNCEQTGHCEIASRGVCQCNRCHHFNRRFKLEEMIPRLGYAAVRTPPMPQRLLGITEARV